MTPRSFDRIRACSHVWISDDDPPIARRPYSPIVGPGRYQMKPGHSYRCRNCESVLTLGAVRPGDQVTDWIAGTSEP